MASIGFGLERIGLVAIARPRMTLALVALISVFCVLGTTRLATEPGLSELFRSSTPEYIEYKKLSAHFPSSEFDLIVAIEAADLMQPERLEAIRNFQLDLQLTETVDSVMSMFSVREPLDAEGNAPSVVPAELPRGEAFRRLSEKILAHPLIVGKLLSKRDGKSQLTVLLVSLKEQILRRDGLIAPIQEIRQAAEAALRPAGLDVKLTGVPAMQVEIDQAMLRDRVIFNGAGFLVGLLVSFFFFRRIMLVLVTSVCPALAVLWALGLVGWLDLKLSTFVNVIPPLVMVITFTDSMHMIFSIRRRLKEGIDRVTAARQAVLHVGPACVLTSLTTSIAFLSLTLTDSGLIRNFGFAASLSTLLAFVVVIGVLPPLVVLLFRDDSKFLEAGSRRHGPIDWLERLCANLAIWLVARHVAVATLGLAAAALFAAAHLQLEPRFRLSEQVPDSKESVSAAQRVDAKLDGIYPVHVMLRWPDGKTLTSPEVLQAISDAHAVLEETPNVANVWSLRTLRQWLAEGGRRSDADLRDYFAKLPQPMSARFANEAVRSALVSGQMSDLDVKDGEIVLARIESALDGLHARHPGFAFTVSGLPAVAARQSSSMIGQLNRSLLVAIVVVIALIGVAFRSAATAAFSIVPNLLPIVAAGAALHLAGGGLEYASVIALTVAFGIAVDDTIHFLNRLRLERAARPSREAAVRQTIARIGPVLFLTTIELVAGLAVTIFSELPTMRLFGGLFIITLAAALAADLLVLPALVLAVRRIRSGGSRN